MDSGVYYYVYFIKNRLDTRLDQHVSTIYAFYNFYNYFRHDWVESQIG